MKLSETIYTRSFLINRKESIKITPRYYSLFRQKVLRRGNNRIRFCVKSTRMNSLLAKFNRQFKPLRFKWETQFLGVEKD